MLKRDLWSKAILLMFVFALLNGTVPIVNCGFVGLKSCYGEPPCEGDFDADRDIDGSDLAVFAADFGRTNCFEDPPCEGDFDGDNDVDGSDLAVFAADFGRTDCPEPIPPDPAEVASEIDPTVATQLGAATEFLYAGDNPIQTGVAPGTIEENRVAVLRGKVLNRENTPLSGVTLTILNHPEYGHTLSREDGMFDMAVNGGGVLTLNYVKEDFLPAQRQTEVPWQDYVYLPDVVLIPLDPQVTVVDLTSSEPMQVARGSLSSDDDGSRQGTILFPQGTSATMKFPDGSTQAISNLSVRATEYTVGDSGPQTMPAELPPTSGYTYAMELSIDEALVAGAKSVSFSQPVLFYVENFRNIPVGWQVPMAYYDHDKAAWVPTDDGRVIEIIDITGGSASIDTDGDGVAEDPSALAAVGITPVEQQKLANLYTVGQSLFRVPVSHFTPQDPNYPRRPRRGAQRPDRSRPKEVINDFYEPFNILGFGSIEAQSQVFHETVGIACTEFSLNYTSNRVPGYKGGNVLNISLSGDTVPPALNAIRLIVEVAGRQFMQNYPPDPNQQIMFEWDGKDTYGRQVYGEQPADVKIGYIYDACYDLPAEEARSFGLAGNPTEDCYPAPNPIILWQSFRTSTGALGSLDARAQGLGGWTLNVHHAYDPIGRTLHLGSGHRRSSVDAGVTIDTAVSREILEAGLSGFGNGPYLSGIDMAADGSLYVTMPHYHVIRRVFPDGTVTTVAGTGIGGYNGDGIPATDSDLYNPIDVAVGPDGSIYIADQFNSIIRRVTEDGIISTVAGMEGQSGYGGDGGPATDAILNYPSGVAVASDGTIYIADTYNNRIRRVGPDGTINTIAGSGEYDCYENEGGDGGQAEEACVPEPSDIVLGTDGSLYIVQYFNGDASWVIPGGVRRIDPSGTIDMVVGGGPCYNYQDGIPATDECLTVPHSVALGSDGNIYVTEGMYDVVRMVRPDGIITTVAGTGEYGYTGDSGPATQAKLRSPAGIAIGPDGTIYIADEGNSVIRTLRTTFPGNSFTGILIPSADGDSLYKFDYGGRHLETLHALTGAIRYSFEYDTENRLIGVTDGDGNETVIERDGSGNPTSIVGVFGQRTTLNLNADGYLESITNPSNEMISIGYGDAGLLTSISSPENAAEPYEMFYDSSGLLTRAEDPENGYTTLTRTSTSATIETTATTALGRETTYREDDLPDGGKLRVVTFPDGTKKSYRIDSDGNDKKEGYTSTTLHNGTQIDVLLGPDPRFGMQAPILKSQRIEVPYDGNNLESNATLERIVTMADPQNPLSVTQLSDTFNVNGRVLSQVFDAASRTFIDTSPEGRQKTTKIDSIGRIIEELTPGLATVIYEYDTFGRLKNETLDSGTETRTLSYSYSATRGYLESVSDALGRSVGYEYDEVGRLTTYTLLNGRQVHYTYDDDGNRTSISPPGQPAHSFAFDKMGLLLEYTPPNTGTGAPKKTQIFYNADAQLANVVRPDGQVIDFDYDAAGRMSAQNLPGGQGEVRYTYDEITGMLKSIESPDGITEILDFYGLLPGNTTWTGQVSGTLSRSYDNNFRITQFDISGAPFTINFEYDDDNLVTGVGYQNPSNFVRLTRDPQHGLIMATHFGSSPYKVEDTREYNAFGELADYTATCNGASCYTVHYNRDPIGRIVERIETIGGLYATYRYAYDLAGQLTEVRDENDVILSSYTYDENGNRLTGPDPILDATYDVQDRLLTYAGNTYTYTENGELHTKTTSGGTTTYTYDVLGNLKVVELPGGTQISYIVDGENRRVGKKIDGTIVNGFLYGDARRPVAELDESSNVVSLFFYASKSNVPDLMLKGGVPYRIVSDHLGSPRLVVNALNGVDVIQRMDYDEFGRVVNDTNPGFQPFGFAGGLYDHDTTLTHFGLRDYDAETGRWTTKDPILFAGFDTNLYGYVLNDPVNVIDPSGLGPSPLVRWTTEGPSFEKDVAPFLMAGIIAGNIATDGMFTQGLNDFDSSTANGGPLSKGPGGGNYAPLGGTKPLYEKPVGSYPMKNFGLQQAIQKQKSLQSKSINKTPPNSKKPSKKVKDILTPTSFEDRNKLIIAGGVIAAAFIAWAMGW